MTTLPDPLAENVWQVSETPPVERIIKEFERSGGLAQSSVNKTRNDRIRYCRWTGRSTDYKKHRSALGKDPVPYEDAWDGRIYTADGIIEDLGAVLNSAFARAQFAMKPTGAEDLAKAANARKVLLKYIDRDREVLNEEAELLWQTGLNYGNAMWHVYWDKCVSMKMVEVKGEALIEAAQRAEQALAGMGNPLTPALSPGPADGGGEGGPAVGGPPPEVIEALAMFASVPELIADPAREDEAVEVFKRIAKALAGQLFHMERDEYGDSWLNNYELTTAQARKAVRQLRKEGYTEFPAPYLSKNAPCATAREVGYDYFGPPEMTDPEVAPWHIVREWLTPAQIMENKVTDGWNPEWCDAVLKTAGQVTEWGSEVQMNDVELDDDTESFDVQRHNRHSTLIEVLHCYARYTTPEGVPQIWCTVLSPHLLHKTSGTGGTDKMWAKHYPLRGSKYGFFPFRWQKKRRNFHQNFGIPELVGSDQQLIKRTHDQLTDRADLELNPPWLVRNRLAMQYKAGPGSQIPIRVPDGVRRAELAAGNPQLGFELIKSAQYRLDNYFGLMTENVLPAKWQMKLQALAGRFLGSCQVMFKYYWELIQEHADEQELQRIAAGDVNFPKTPEEIEGEYDVSLYFDVKDLDMEFVFKKLEAVSNMAVPLDRAGTLDLSALVRMIVLAIDPTYAQALLTDKEGASRRVYRDVDTEVLRMFAGNEADYVESDPTAKMKLEFLDQVLKSNPRYVQAINPEGNGEQDPLFKARLDKYVKNLQQSVTQQQNKQVGRLGVVPDSAAQMVNGEA